jgi:hypothetical protein
MDSDSAVKRAWPDFLPLHVNPHHLEVGENALVNGSGIDNRGWYVRFMFHADINGTIQTIDHRCWVREDGSLAKRDSMILHRGALPSRSQNIRYDFREDS